MKSRNICSAPLASLAALARELRAFCHAARFGFMVARLGTSWHILARLGTIFAHLGAILGDLGAILVRLGAILGRRGAILGASWGRPGPSCRQPGPSWERLGLAKASQASQKTLKFRMFLKGFLNFDIFEFEAVLDAS